MGSESLKRAGDRYRAGVNGIQETPRHGEGMNKSMSCPGNRWKLCQLASPASRCVWCSGGTVFCPLCLNAHNSPTLCRRSKRACQSYTSRDSIWLVPRVINNRNISHGRSSRQPATHSGAILPYKTGYSYLNTAGELATTSSTEGVAWTSPNSSMSLTNSSYRFYITDFTFSEYPSRKMQSLFVTVAGKNPWLCSTFS